MRKKFTIVLCLSGLAGCLFFACGKTGGRPDGDRQLAMVYNKPLFLSDMDGMLPEGIAQEDSALIIDQFVKNWVRETALLHEAEKNIPKGLNITKLVNDYRASLIKHNYENILVQNLLDSLVSPDQLEEFYEKNKEEYQLETPIIRCRLIKAPRVSPRLADVENWWKSDDEGDLKLLTAWCEKNAATHHLKDSLWYKVTDMAAYMPQGMLTVDNVSGKQDFTKRDGEFIYLFKVLELVPRKEYAPLAYIEGQAKKVILHKRKTQILEVMKDRLYKEAVQKNQISIYE